MKKVFLLTIAAGVSVSGFAQRAKTTHATTIRTVNTTPAAISGTTARTTAVGDTTILENISGTDTLIIYRAGSTLDSGFVTGMDNYGDRGYAERYDFNGTDSSLEVIGVIAEFGGVVNPASTKTVHFKIWDVSAQVPITSTLLYSGFPNNVLDSAVVPVTELGIAATGDSIKEYLFPVSTGALSSSFYVGYDINYDATNFGGDTIGLVTSLNGERTSPIAYLSGADTIINVQNATQFSDFSWNDNATENFQIFNNLFIFPVVIVHGPTGVSSVTKNGLTFFGNYPNPAVNSTNIKFSLATATDVTIQVTDMTGRVINTINQNNLAAGDHIIPVTTSALPSGDYLYLVHTAQGGNLAGKMSVIK